MVATQVVRMVELIARILRQPLDRLRIGRRA